MKACIASFHMRNIADHTVMLQKQCVRKYNPSDIMHYNILIDIPHGNAIDYFWSICGFPTEQFKNNTEKQLDFDVILFLDIDCIPLSPNAIDYFITEAAKGKIVGNIQRSNHIQNGQHVFAAPSALCLSAETFERIGRPSAMETARSDVAEEYTWNAERVGVPVEMLMPLKYDEAPMRYDWEKDQPPYWPLADGMPVYGMGTTYGLDDGTPMFFHNFQIRMQGQQDKFWKKCESILGSV